MNNYVVKLAVILMVISGLSAALLGLSDDITAPVIAERQRQEMEENMFEYFPEANQFDIEEVDDEEYYLVFDDEDILGVSTIATPGGYGGEIEMMVAVDVAGTVRGIEIMSHSETPGIADGIEEEEWQEQFVELTIFDDIEITSDVEAVSGATTSSEGIASGVREGLDAIALDYFQRDPEDFPEIKDAPDQIEDGVFEGVGMGTEDGIEVEVTVNDGEITDIQLIDHNESEAYLEMAWDEVSQQIMEENTPNVDTVSRATQSSLGIMEAVQNAIEGIEDDGEVELEDGTFQGEGDGHSPGIVVEITVSDGEITDLELVEHSETEEIMESAWESMKTRILDEQTTEVDTESGATQSSYGIMEAVEGALMEAEDSPIDLEDGVYVGEASGRNPGIAVEVTVIDGELNSLELLDHSESSEYMNPAWDTLSDDMLEQQEINVDIVSGATQSSEGIINAVEAALDEDARIGDVDEVAVEYDDGSYTGIGEGYNDDVEVEITIEDGEITDMELVEHDDTDDIMEDAWDEMPDRMINEQSTDVDTVSDATGSSEGIMEAVEQALDEAAELPEELEGTGELEDGEYTGVGEGYNDDVEVEITVDEGEIVELELVEHDDTDDIMEDAWDEMPDRIINEQSTDVDTVTDATGSSEGIIVAVEEAMNEARGGPETVDEDDEDEKDLAIDFEEMDLTDGDYTGTAEGHNDDIEVEVTVTDAEVTNFELLYHDDTEDLMEDVWEQMTERIITEQSSDVDVVQGATASSEGIIEATIDALEDAEE